MVATETERKHFTSWQFGTIWRKYPPALKCERRVGMDQVSEGMAVGKARDVLGQPGNITVLNHSDLQKTNQWRSGADNCR